MPVTPSQAAASFPSPSCRPAPPDAAALSTLFTHRPSSPCTPYTALGMLTGGTTGPPHSLPKRVPIGLCQPPSEQHPPGGTGFTAVLGTGRLRGCAGGEGAGSCARARSPCSCEDLRSCCRGSAELVAPPFLPGSDAPLRGSVACRGCSRPVHPVRALRGPGVRPLSPRWAQVHLVPCSARVGPGWGCISVALSSRACLETKEPARNPRALANSRAAGEMLRPAGSGRTAHPQEWLDPSQSVDFSSDLSHVSSACAVPRWFWVGLSDAEGVQSPGVALWCRTAVWLTWGFVWLGPGTAFEWRTAGEALCGLS